MSKTNIILLSVILIILVAGGIASYFVLSPKKVTVPQAAFNESAITNIQEELVGDKTFEDSAGFSFLYPSSFSVTDITPDSNNYYSKLEIYGANGKLVLNATDTRHKTVGDWQAVNKDATLVGATSWAGMKANQYTKGNILITVAVDQGVLYTLENVTDNGMLDDLHSLVLANFKFNDQATTVAASGQSGEVEYEEEEVVE